MPGAGTGLRSQAGAALRLPRLRGGCGRPGLSPAGAVLTLLPLPLCWEDSRSLSKTWPSATASRMPSQMLPGRRAPSPTSLCAELAPPPDPLLPLSHWTPEGRNGVWPMAALRLAGLNGKEVPRAVTSHPTRGGQGRALWTPASSLRGPHPVLPSAGRRGAARARWPAGELGAVQSRGGGPQAYRESHL